MFTGGIVTAIIAIVCGIMAWIAFTDKDSMFSKEDKESSLAGFAIFLAISITCFVKDYDKTVAAATEEQTSLHVEISKLRSELNLIKNRPKYEATCAKYGAFQGKTFVYYRIESGTAFPNTCLEDIQYETTRQKRLATIWMHTVEKELKIMKRVKVLQ